MAKTCCKCKKIPQLSMRVREFFGAASRNRTGTVLRPGDFKSPASTSSAMAACSYYTRTSTVCQTMPAADLRIFQFCTCSFPLALFQVMFYNEHNRYPAAVTASCSACPFDTPEKCFEKGGTNHIVQASKLMYDNDPHRSSGRAVGVVPIAGIIMVI